MVADAGLGMNLRTASLNSGKTAPNAFQNSLNTTLQQNNGCVNDETIISQIKKAQKIRGAQANTGITSASQNPGSVSQGTANVTQSPEDVGLVACESRADESILQNNAGVNYIREDKSASPAAIAAWKGAYYKLITAYAKDT